MIYLHTHFFDFVPAAEYFDHNDDALNINKSASIIGLAYYEFDYEKIINLINQVKFKTDKLIVYIKEPLSPVLIDLVKKYEPEENIKFFGDAVFNIDCKNWKPALSWFVSPRHYYQVDDWAKNILSKIDYADSKKKYYFDCLLGIEKSNRSFVERCYQQSTHKNLFIFNYFKDNVSDGIWDRDISEITSTSQSISFDEYQVALSAIVPHYIYNQSSHSIVAETSFYNEFSHMTEKTAKPIMAERIFVAFCGQHYLQNLRSLGFQTFSQVIDESYDLESDPDKRFALAWQQVEYLCSQDPIKIRSKIKSVLSHNRELFLNSDWHCLVKQCLQC